MIVEFTVFREETLKIDKKSFIGQHAKVLKYALENDFSETIINRMAKQSGFVVRPRKLSPSCFVNTLMFLAYNQAKASLPDMTADLKQQFGTITSKEGLHKKFTGKAVKFLEALIKRWLTEQFTQQGDDGLKKRFPSIIVKDSSKFSLPCNHDGNYPGYGNFGKNIELMNIQYEHELVSGNWTDIKLTSIKSNDQKESNQTIDSIGKGTFISVIWDISPLLT